MLQKFSLSNDHRDFYRENGYLVLKDLFSKAELEGVLGEILDLFGTRFSRTLSDKFSGYELLVHQYGTEMWQQCARRMWDLVTVLGVAANPRVAEALRKIDLAKPMVATRPEVRTDMPNDQRYRQPWHQDWRYGQCSFNAATIWIPLQKVNVDNGTIDIIPKSHLMGLLETEELKEPRRFSITDPRIEKMDHHPVELELGECVIFSQMLVHRSGTNITRSPRISVQLRYTDYSDSSFIAQGYPVAPSSELVWKQLPTENDMQRIYGVQHRN
jgi:phytanoyl-CoA hydroxylase